MRAILLFPFTLVYYLINLIWNFYWSRKTPIKVNSKVISIGNIAVGGTSKTTLTIHIARRLQSTGRKIAVVARGYKRKSSAAQIISSDSDISWAECGDEPIVIARSVPGISVYIDSDKTSAAIRAADDGNDIILIDDGFQHRKLHRDIDIVCINSHKPFGNGLLLPSGILREPPGSLDRADIIVVNKDNNDSRSMDFKSNKAVFKSSKICSGVKSIRGDSVRIDENPVVAFCGLGNPESFRSSLESENIKVADFIQFRDHHIYSTRDIDNIIDIMKRSNAAIAVTSLKDIVKLEKIWPANYNLCYLDISIILDNESEFYKLLSI